MQWRTTRRNRSLIGGYHYRMTSNGVTVKVQERSPRSKSYRTKAEMPKSLYDTICAETRHDTEADTWLYNLSMGVA